MIRKEVLEYTENWVSILEKEISGMEKCRERNLKEEQLKILKALYGFSDMEIETPFGSFYPTKSMDPEYPGVAITFEYASGGGEKDISYVEYAKELEAIRAFKWEHNEEDYIDQQIFYNQKMFEEDQQEMDA